MQHNSSRSPWLITVKSIALFALLTALTACGSTPTPEPTLDLQPLVDQIVQATLSALPTATPLPTETPIPPTSVPTLSIPTATPTPLPPTATISPDDPAVALGQPDYVDNFNNSNGWTLFDDECFKSKISDGKYIMTNKGNLNISCWEMSAVKEKDMYLQTLVTMPEKCTPNDRFGMIFRAPDLNQGYLLGLTCDGRFFLFKWDGKKTITLIPFGSNPAILTGSGKENRLGVKAVGDSYTIYANGILLGNAIDNQYIEKGLIGYFTGASAGEAFTVKFDDLSVWRLP